MLCIMTTASLLTLTVATVPVLASRLTAELTGYTNSAIYSIDTASGALTDLGA